MAEPLEGRLLLSKTIYVDVNSPAPATNGPSWSQAYKDLQLALGVAVSGDTIKVADGTYKPTSGTDRTISFQLMTGVAIYGGYAGYGAPNPDARNVTGTPSILSGDIGTVGTNTDNSYHVLVGSGTTSTAVLDGFTITAGNANGSGSPTYYGGGMYNSPGSPTLTNCTFSGNSASYGGGMENDTSSPRLTNCTFSGNSASSYGGGMDSSSSSPTLTNCTFSGNSASAGGGMYNYSSGPTLTNCTFSGNSASSSGGGVYSSSSNPKLTNCILWGNGNSPIYNYSSTPVITYSDIQGGYTGTGNLNVDPLFVRNPSGTDYGDLRLRLSSPAIDAGKNADVPAGTTTDLGGGPRFKDVPSKADTGAGTAPIVDMGAYEASWSTVMYVDPNATGIEDGTTWATAYRSFASALAMAISGQEIRVADGTYKPTPGTDRSISFQLKSGVACFGGYAGCGAADPNARDVVANPSILSGDLGTAGNNTDNSYHVVVGSGTDSTAILDGITIAAGNADTSSFPTYCGSGMFNSFGSPTLFNCTFSGNSASYGGGIFNTLSSSPALTNCTFSGNTAGSGGGIYNNSSSNPTLTNCMFTGNSAFHGGGVYSYSSDGVTSNPTLTNCTFSGNSAIGNGGGMFSYDWNSSSSATLTNCTFSGNTADFGGGMYNTHSATSLVLVNCVFIGNSGVCGGGMYNDSASSPTLTNCTFSGNTASISDGGIANFGSGIYNSASSPRLTNCIIWGSGSLPIFNYGSSTPVITYSDIQGGYAGIGNISADPLFVRSPWTGFDGLFGTTDDDYGDVRLRTGSPALDIGSNSAIPAGVITDLAGNGRIQNGTVDMGAYEGPVTAPTSKTIYVDLNAAGVNNGASWTNAFTSLQSALLVSIDGDTIRIADGAYKPTSTNDRTICFALRNAVGIYGGYAGYGAPNPNARDIVAYPTVLSADIGTISDTSDNSYHVLTASGVGSSTVLDGFTVTGGEADGPGASQSMGGGLFAKGSSPSLTNCAFSGNTAFGSYGYGGGMYNTASSSPSLINCTFIGNSASGRGGGMYNDFIASPELINCMFSGNSASSDGGGMYNIAISSPRLTDCVFNGNSAYRGGGMYSYHWNSSTSATLTNCTFSGNSASYGGGMENDTSSPRLTNCTFSGNSASSYGGGMYNNALSNPTLTNCILWGNGNSPIYNYSSTPAITYSDIQGGFTGTGNINSDPLFLRNPSGSDYGDLRLKPTSPCIDAGSNAAVPAGITTDLVGNTRIVDYPGVHDPGAIVDMGAYERQLPLAVSSGADTAINEGSGLARSGSFTDADITDTLTATVNYGDGGAMIPLTLNADKSFLLAHTYEENGLYAVTVSGTSSNNGSAAGSFKVTVNNVATAVALPVSLRMSLGTPLATTGSFTDPGPNDTWTATVNYADGSGPQALALNADKTFILNKTYPTPGTYPVTVTITDKDGSAGTATLLARVTGIVARSIFYNNSFYDGNDPAANAADDNAIATDKQALLPGQQASFANYTSFSKGINGIMIDLANPASSPGIAAADFLFRVGNSATPDAWTTAPAPSVVVVRSVAGADRIELVWPDGAIRRQWLQVTVLADANTGLAAPDVFYFGNAIGESGNSTTDAAVTSADMLAARGHPAAGPVAITNPWDYNRDGSVNSADTTVAQTNQTAGSAVLILLAGGTGRANRAIGAGGWRPGIPILPDRSDRHKPNRRQPCPGHPGQEAVGFALLSPSCGVSLPDGGLRQQSRY
ncbi:MAG: right-handed parallel beta-helix repeat-containing protein [Tepidisphaerales bacterium]